MQNLSIKEREILEEINDTLNSFSIMREFAIVIFTGIIFLIGAIVAISLGELLLIAIILGGGFLLQFIGIKVVDTKPNKSKFAYDVCLLMDRCLIERTENYRKVGDAFILSFSTFSNNRDLYKKFVKVYPEMQSFKLWYLSGVQIEQL